jgi:hypothetical protein
MLDEDADLRADLAPLGAGTLVDFRRVLKGSADYRHAILVPLMTERVYADLATLMAPHASPMAPAAVLDPTATLTLAHR